MGVYSALILHKRNVVIVERRRRDAKRAHSMESNALLLRASLYLQA
jgi:hypothetical protein